MTTLKKWEPRIIGAAEIIAINTDPATNITTLTLNGEHVESGDVRIDVDANWVEEHSPAVGEFYAELPSGATSLQSDLPDSHQLATPLSAGATVLLDSIAEIAQRAKK